MWASNSKHAMDCELQMLAKSVWAAPRSMRSVKERKWRGLKTDTSYPYFLRGGAKHKMYACLVNVHTKATTPMAIEDNVHALQLAQT